MKVKRYVSGSPNGDLQSMQGKTARAVLQERAASATWFANNYPIIYELVPVPAEKLKPKKRTAAKPAKGKR